MSKQRVPIDKAAFSRNASEDGLIVVPGMSEILYVMAHCPVPYTVHPDCNQHHNIGVDITMRRRWAEAAIIAAGKSLDEA